MVTIFYFLDGFTLTVPGDQSGDWEAARRGELVFLVRPARGSVVDAGAAYRIEVKGGY